MPGQGRLTARACSAAEHAAIAEGALAQDLSPEQAVALLGEQTCDVCLNHVASWRNIPARVWAYILGGYQVIKKWLSYREQPLLGRPLTPEEVRQVREIARRIAAILLLEPALEANYRRVTQAPADW